MSLSETWPNKLCNTLIAKSDAFMILHDWFISFTNYKFSLYIWLSWNDGRRWKTDASSITKSLVTQSLWDNYFRFSLIWCKRSWNIDLDYDLISLWLKSMALHLMVKPSFSAVFFSCYTFIFQKISFHLIICFCNFLYFFHIILSRKCKKINPCGKNIAVYNDVTTTRKHIKRHRFT